MGERGEKGAEAVAIEVSSSSQSSLCLSTADHGLIGIVAAAVASEWRKPWWVWLLHGFPNSNSNSSTTTTTTTSISSSRSSSTTAREQVNLEEQYLVFKQRKLASNDVLTLLYLTAVAATLAHSLPGDPLALYCSKAVLLLLVMGPSAAVVACRPMMGAGRRDCWVFWASWMGFVVAVLLASGVLLPPLMLENLLRSSNWRTEVPVLLSNGVVKPGLYRVRGDGHARYSCVGIDVSGSAAHALSRS
jgi:hypothetical protein